MADLSILEDLLNIESPVDFRTFVTSPDYCGNPDMYAYWFAQEEKHGHDMNELILDGSLGGGKSYYGSYLIAYRIYLLFHAGNPQRQLGLAPDADIYVLYFSVSITMAKRSGFQYLYTIFDTCQWFKTHCPINTKKSSEVEFVGRHFTICYASGAGHQIGLNVWGFLLDEANFKGGDVGQGTEDQYSAVTELYEQLLDRQLSRFARPDGSTDSLAILISSASYQTSFVEKRKQAIKGNSHAVVITSRSYETKPHRFSSTTFPVFIGAGAAEPAIVTSEDHALKLLQNANIPIGERDAFILNVPDNLKPSFERNIVLALQNHCGVPTNMSSSFMTNMAYLFNAYTKDIPPLFTSDTLEASNGDDTELFEYFISSNVQYSERPHCLFLDLSLQHDMCCLCCYRYDGLVDDHHMHTRVFSLHIKPPLFPHKTKIAKVQRLVLFVASKLNVVAFGSDQYQSEQLRQEICDALGLENLRVSIDSSDVPHLTWMQGLQEGRIRMSADPDLETEVREAIHDWKKRRVLKATSSSDDILQANVGAFFLSDTVGKDGGTLSGLYQGPTNFVGSGAYKKLINYLDRSYQG